MPVLTVTGGSSPSVLNGAAMNAQDVCQAADGFRTHEMSVGVIDFLEPVQIGQHDGKRPPGAFVAFDFRVQSVQQPPVVGKPRERIGDRQSAHLCSVNSAASAMEVTAMTPIKDCNNSRDVFCESLANGPNPCAVPHVAIAARAQVAVIALRRPNRNAAQTRKGMQTYSNG